MDADLANRLRIAFPTGVDWEHDAAALDGNDQTIRITKALSTLGDHIRVEPDFQWQLLKGFTVTLKSTPSFSTWIWSFGRQSKIDWIRKNNAYYVVLWLQVSRVADYFRWHFNHWHPRGETGYLDADCNIEPDAQWCSTLKTLTTALEEHGFKHATQEIISERVDFIYTYGGDEIPEDDPRWNDIEFEPPPTKASVYKCLFGHR
jgi:hypothetical protein